MPGVEEIPPLAGCTDVVVDLPPVVEAAHAKGVPVIVDCAAQLPPRRNLTDVLATGADLAVFECFTVFPRS